MDVQDFTCIHQPDGTCINWDCGKEGVILAYDDFSPECAYWFCAECWDNAPEYAVLLTIVEDRRLKREVRCE